jgi:hypothetical protein
MYNSDTELLFPIRVIPALVGLRGDDWQSLVQRISGDEPAIVDQLAFVYMMVRLGGCMTCNADSFRAMRGCTQCARQTVRRFRGSDWDLLEQYQQSRRDIQAFVQKQGIEDGALLS